MGDSSYNSPVRSSYGSPARSLKMLDRVYGSPVRSYCGDHSSATESEGEDFASLDPLQTEIPGSPDQTVIDGWLKFRDNKKWRHRWGVMTKLSPAAEGQLQCAVPLAFNRVVVSTYTCRGLNNNNNTWGESVLKCGNLHKYNNAVRVFCMRRASLELFKLTKYTVVSSSSSSMLRPFFKWAFTSLLMSLHIYNAH
ncbi:PH domain-like [Cinara cedri]|uniref:PH domain-like n=1 Tax=Cinara cedri TaxID=506608 RepID=A0A5E4NCP3_9HEMI|nr:PH domain-like [Cinara cedri]